MAYEPKTWACGDTVTAEALNHLEQGVADASSGGGMVIRLDHIEYDTSGLATNYIYDKTWKEVNDAFESGQFVTIRLGDAEELFALIVGTPSSRGWGADAYRFGSYSEPITYLYACSEDGYLQSAQCNSGDGGK